MLPGPGVRAATAAQSRGVNDVLANAVGAAAICTAVGIMAATVLTAEQMSVVWPALVCAGVFAGFALVLSLRVGGNLCGEVGFVYVGIALAYTVVPAMKLLSTNFNLPSTYEPTLVALSPTAEALGAHFWRQALFMSGVAAGYLVVRAMPLTSQPKAPGTFHGYGMAVTFMVLVVACSIGLEAYLAQPASVYVEHYTRFDQLSAPLRRLGVLSTLLKRSGYWVLLVLLFQRYRHRRLAIGVLVATICVYETWYSLGSRLEAFSILLATFGLYHYQARTIDVRKGAVALAALAFLFSAVGLVRHVGYSLDGALDSIKGRSIQVSEFDAVFASGFHVYDERSRGTLPPRDARMFFWEFFAVTPFVDHTTFQPQYWYARNYFPEAVVPPTTLGVVAESGLWGGEADLLMRSLLNGALFAALMRWFLRRRWKWWAQTVYIYCYATCILTLKYSVLYQLIPLVWVVLPGVALTAFVLGVEKALRPGRAVHV
jgi:hypothetical protein